jgi:hypothetical protein
LQYQGNDPSYASSWSLCGTFRVGRPIGRKCFTRFGSDVALISADGLIPLSKALLTDRSAREDAISDKIINLINNDVQTYAANPGWQVVLYPIGNKLVVNVPATPVPYQYVMNTITGAWCKFTGWFASCFETMADSMYYGGGGVVYQCDTGTNDAGAAISCTAIQAPNYFGSHTNKQFTMARPILTAAAQINPAFAINADFDNTTPIATTGFSNPSVTPWGSPWGSPWSSSNQVYKDWQTVGSIGFAGSPAMAFQVSGTPVTWQSTDVAFIRGGAL